MPAKKTTAKKTVAKGTARKPEREKTSAGPAMWRYSKDIYDDMDKGAEEMLVDNRKTRVYKGAMSGLFSKYHISSPYYGPVTKFLRDVKAIELIRRGNGMAESLWEVGKRPTKAEFDAWNKKEGTRNYQSRKRSAEYLALIQVVEDLKKQLGAINIPKAFVEVGKDIKELKKRVGELEKDMGVASDK